MEKINNKELLTSELFLQISGDKTKRIVVLKKLREQLKMDIAAERENLASLEDLKREIEEKISISQTNLSKLKSRKFTVVREIGTQKRLSRKINRLATKNVEVEIDTTKFYPENKQKKR